MRSQLVRNSGPEQAGSCIGPVQAAGLSQADPVSGKDIQTTYFLRTFKCFKKVMVWFSGASIVNAAEALRKVHFEYDAGGAISTKSQNMRRATCYPPK